MMELRLFTCVTLLLSLNQWAGVVGERTVPLTQIAPEPVELAAFASTVSGAISRLNVSSTHVGRPLVVHVVGASSVERAVDWKSVCAEHGGARIVLIGPQIGNTLDADDGESASTTASEDCQVTAVEGLFSKSLLIAELGAASPAISPDVVVLHNADVYMPYWRRTLAELLQLHSEFHRRIVPGTISIPRAGAISKNNKQCTYSRRLNVCRTGCTHRIL